MNESHPLVNGQATTVKKVFSRQTSVAIDIAAPQEKVWTLLTDTDKFKVWNSTIVELTGKIAFGETIRLRTKLAPKRVFKLKVKQFEPPRLLSWGDAMGTRTSALSPNAEAGTRFNMTEKIGGPIFPLFAGMIPPFDESFNQFAADLKSAAEEKA
jgi:uncharacterized protein YndB with AHSA1/START domain